MGGLRFKGSARSPHKRYVHTRDLWYVNYGDRSQKSLSFKRPS